MKKIYVKPAQKVTEVRSAFLFAASSFDLNQSTVEEKDLLVRSNEWEDIWEK